MATVLKGVASAQNDTRGPSATKTPNHVVHQNPPATPAAATTAATSATVAFTGVTPTNLVGTALVIGTADAHDCPGMYTIDMAGMPPGPLGCGCDGFMLLTLHLCRQCAKCDRLQNWYLPVRFQKNNLLV